MKVERREWTMAGAKDQSWKLLTDGYSVTIKRQRQSNGSPDLSYLIVGIKLEPKPEPIEVPKPAPPPADPPRIPNGNVFYADPTAPERCVRCGDGFLDHRSDGHCKSKPYPHVRYHDDDPMFPDDDDDDDGDVREWEGNHR